MPDRDAIPETPEPDAGPGWKLRLEERLGLLDPIQILAYRSYGTPDALHIRGRVSERKAVADTTEKSPVWRNIMNTLHRLDSDEIPGAHVRAHFQGKQWNTTTDGEGYFVLDLDPVETLDAGWHDVSLELVSSVGEPEKHRFVEPVLVPFPDAEFAVISDLDDTVIRTKANELFQQIAVVFGNSARGRTPFPGVPALYRALHRGPDDRGRNPMFYVSLSGWNLYDLFEEFMQANDIPLGPLFLADLRLIEGKSAVMGSDDHKFESIDVLLRVYPELPFVLIGDSGQHDPETYARVVKQHPGRIRAVYIRDVTPDQRDEELDDIAAKLAEEGVPLVRAQDALRVAEHAAGHRLISSRHVDEVRAAVEQEDGD